MAIEYRISSNNWIFSLQVLCVSIVALYTTMTFFLKLSVPTTLDFLVTEVPLLWNSMNYWLSPPYLYILINGIIITIAASSRFQYKIEYQIMETVNPPISKNFDESNLDFVDSKSTEISTDCDHVDLVTVMKKQVNFVPDLEESASFNLDLYGAQTIEGDSSKMKNNNPISVTNQEDDFVDRGLKRRDSVMEISSEFPFSEEKPPVSTRFSHRKTVKASNNEAGKGLRPVTKPKRQDTLESTWKTITEGRSIPLARHLKKSDTWETHNSSSHVSPSSPLETSDGVKKKKKKNMKKSETLKDGQSQMVNQSSSASLHGSMRLRKEPSLSQDELNRRVEAFITKFNEEMRLQRQESLNQYKEMVSQGLHLY